MSKKYKITPSCKRTILYVIIALCLITLFHQKINNFFSKVLLLFSIDFGTAYVDIVFFVLVLLGLVFITLNWFEKNKKHLLIGYLFFLFLYAMDSCLWKHWQYTEMALFPISYLSAIAFLPLLVLGKIGIEEAHITKIEETKSLEPSDDFGYTEHAKKLFYFLKERTSLDSYTIGINAKWGEGKTFFIDLLKKQFTQNKEEVIIVDFKPWFSHSPLDIINDFFIVYGERLREEGIYIQSDLERYKNALMGIEVSDTFLNQLIKIIKNLLSNESNSSSILYDKINSVLANRKRKIIVIIDDLDRSTKEELFEVIKLVRNSGSLANTYFILAYDREYLEGALSNLSIANHEKYLEKIIQLELKLPVILATNYNSYSAKYVAENYPNYKEVWNKFLVTINDDSFSIFNAELCNIRYVQVFIDKLFYEYKSENVKSEVYFPDFILLNLMKEEKQFNTTDFVEICLQSSFIGNTGFLRVPVIEKVNDKFND